MNETIYLTDRSAAETDDRCGMKYWWQRKEGGIGIVPATDSIHLVVGRRIHEDLSEIARAPDISPEAVHAICLSIWDNIPEEEKKTSKELELIHRHLGWVAAFALFVEPKLREEFRTVQIEHEVILDRTPLWVPTTPDRVLERIEDNKLVYWEYKSTGICSGKWMNSWVRAIQLHVGMAALEEELGRPVQFAQVMALVKGSTREGRLRHPYVWAYHNKSTDAWTHEARRGQDWTLRPIWEYPDGPVAWVQQCGEEIAMEQFPLSPPVFLDRRQVDDWVRRRLYRERRVREVLDECTFDLEARAIHFEKRTSQCRPPMGEQCPYLSACWNAEVERDPLAHGFVKREPHHDVEALGIDE